MGQTQQTQQIAQVQVSQTQVQGSSGQVAGTPVQMAVPLTPGSPLSKIHSLMQRTNFVEDESYFHKMSKSKQKETLEDIEHEGEEGDEENDADQKEIQRGPRFKHYGHDRRGHHAHKYPRKQ